MRVLIAAGGTAGHINPALAIAGALKAADPTAEIHFAGRREGMEYGLVTKAGYPFHHIEINGFQRHLSLENIGRNIVAIWHLALSGPHTRKILNEVKPDLVLTYTIKPNIYGGLACRMAHIPYAVNITGLGSAIENGGLLRKFILMLYKVSLKGVRVVFFENAANRDALVNAGVVPQGRDVVLNGAGVNLNDYPYQEYPNDGTVRFLFVGRIMKEKGVDEFFVAAERMKKKYGKRVKFRMAGMFEEAYKQRIDEQLSTLVIKQI